MSTHMEFGPAEEPPGAALHAPIHVVSLPMPEVKRRTTLPALTIAAEVRRAPVQSFVHSAAAAAFRKTYFPFATRSQWNDWRWQLANRVTSHAQLERVLHLSAEEDAACRPSATGRGTLPVAVTPYYLGLIDPDNAQHALRRCMVPTVRELERAPGEAEDPLAEDHDSPVPGLVHRYPDRVLFLATDYCSAYCRYCTRSRLVGRRKGPASRAQLQAGLDYIASAPEVRDVLISGGDPLTMPDEALEWLLASLRRIKSVEVVRIGTKVPAVLPQRITKQLVRMLRKYHPLWLSLHCTHPEELTPEMGEACERLADAGIPLGSQTVLLKGVNDSVPTLTRLYQGLMRMRVRPYYLYQCDPICGSAHFRTPVSTGLEMIKGLRGHTTGYAVPHYVVDAPGGGGKIPLLPETSLGHDADGNLLLRNYEGKIFHYPDRVEG